MKLKHIVSILPVIGLLVGIPFVNRAEPYILGMPPMMFWVALWTVLTSVTMFIVYKLEKKQESG
ncbi:uncharacterized protein DUF3311 [Scopulibacillus darangshiensis]|uniref:Uncharacterized protein DUF3311 n=1 Tax=Scopulibacillus darangshiensis TaxID=442528 RepID=A0A4R2P7W4_9BACL|nr:DUF3311 domain-containing protein [Scopulibacillus darangshiensis]TCP30907.1 uncharacterized protein DUF3311 [Scopulibacillus darangshiensis]